VKLFPMCFLLALSVPAGAQKIEVSELEHAQQKSDAIPIFRVLNDPAKFLDQGEWFVGFVSPDANGNFRLFVDPTSAKANVLQYSVLIDLTVNADEKAAGELREMTYGEYVQIYGRLVRSERSYGIDQFRIVNLGPEIHYFFRAGQAPEEILRKFREDKK
jgi:hypothetical protein